MSFWKILDNFIVTHPIVIDRHKGSAHPTFKEMIYPVEYGFIEHTKSMDGKGIDVFVGSKKNKAIEGIICTADKTKLDSEIKIMYGCTKTEIDAVLNFLNQSAAMKALFIKRSDK